MCVFVSRIRNPSSAAYRLGPITAPLPSSLFAMSNGQLEDYMDVVYLSPPAQSECVINQFPFRSLEGNGVPWE